MTVCYRLPEEACSGSLFFPNTEYRAGPQQLRAAGG